MKKPTQKLPKKLPNKLQFKKASAIALGVITLAGLGFAQVKDSNVQDLKRTLKEGSKDIAGLIVGASIPQQQSRENSPPPSLGALGSRSLPVQETIEASPSPSAPMDDSSLTAIDCDVIVVDSNLGGVAAALQVARYGTKVCMTSMTDWIGGQISTQAVSAIDGPYHFGKEADKEFLEKYTTKQADGSYITSKDDSYLAYDRYYGKPHLEETLRTMRPFLNNVGGLANCWVSHHCFRPNEGDRALKKLIEPYIAAGFLKVFYQAVPKKVYKDGDKITHIDFVQRSYTGRGARPYTIRLSEEIGDWYELQDSERYQKNKITLKGKVIIDSSETGEVVVLSGANHVQGYDELVQFGSRSSNEQANTDPECVMGFVFPTNLVAEKPSAEDLKKISAIEKPTNLAPFDLTHGQTYRFWKDDTVHFSKKNLSIFDYRRISNQPQITMLNWSNGGNDFTTENFIIPAASLSEQLVDWKGGIRIDALAHAEARALHYIQYMNQQPEVQFKNRGVAPIFNIDDPRNFFGTGTSLSKYPYIRDTRRIIGYKGFMMKPEQVMTDSAALGEFLDGQYTNFYDSLGIGSYPLDVRSCPTGKVVGRFAKHYANHAQIPLRSLVSENVSNLMVANKTWAMTQIVNAALRVQPTEWNAGFGAGSAAGVAVNKNLTLHQIMGQLEYIQEAQWRVIQNSGRVLWFSDKLPGSNAF